MKLNDFVSKNSFATLITFTDNLSVSHINLLFDGEDEGTLYGHIAAANPQSAHFSKNTTVLAVFNRDIIIPQKTYAYYVHGELQIVDDLKEKQRILDRLIQHYEKSSWSVNWDNKRYLDQLSGIIFFALKITHFKEQLAEQVLPAQSSPCMIASYHTDFNMMVVPETLVPRLNLSPTVYIPKAFREDDEAQLWPFVSYHSLSLVVMYGEQGLNVRYVHLRRLDEQSCLYGETAAFGDFPLNRQQVFVIVKGPHCYVSPRFYPSAVNVPTWNYTMAYLQGEISFYPHASDTTVAMTIQVTHLYGKFKLSQNRTCMDRTGVLNHLSCSGDASLQAVASCMRK